MATLALGDGVNQLRGVGPNRARDLKKLGVETIEDLVFLWPRRHLDRTQLTPLWQVRVGETATVKARIESAVVRGVGSKSYLRLIVQDPTGRLEVTFFHAAWLKRQLVPGCDVLLSGKVDRFHGHLSMTHPDFEILRPGDTPRLGLVPVYPLAGDLKQRFLQDLTAEVVPQFAPAMPDLLPEHIRRQQGLVERGWAILHQHWPASVNEREQSRRRLVFDEFLRMSLAVQWLHRTEPGIAAPSLDTANPLLAQFLDTLPFVLTAGQREAWQEIAGDLSRAVPMARLLQGDVGSGKTVLAVLAMLAAVGSGYQAALMAPTELLAEQHALLLTRQLEAMKVPVLVFSGKSRAKDSASRLAAGEPVVAVGTQALLSERLAFGRLGVVVVDEQHRFGVRQRAQLGEKGLYPHMLVMTATPIPRTLALTVYGDLAVSEIVGLPPGRKPVKTIHLPMSERRQAYLKVMEAVREGRQAYVICRLVEENEESQGKAATLLAEGMRQVRGWRVGLVHGRLPAEEKASVMEAFRRGDLDVLVGTTILEVGVDVPNATVMVIEEADRFGLAQLHQLRGRVGRGEYPSTCYLLADPTTKEGEARIQAMLETESGLELSERDLEIRGPGEVLGMRQHGVAGFQLANPLQDLAALEVARHLAHEILDQDPRLEWPQHQGLRQWVMEALQDALSGHVLH